MRRVHIPNHAAARNPSRYVRLGDGDIFELRILGGLFAYRQYSDVKKMGVSYVKVGFPDAALTKKITRIAAFEDKDNEWAKNGFKENIRYAANVIVRNGPAGASNEVLIYDFGQSIAQKIIDIEQANRSANFQFGSTLPSFIGGRESVTVFVRREAASKTGLPKIDLTVGSHDVLTATDIAAIALIGIAPLDLIAKEREAYERERHNQPNLQLPVWEDWFVYGHDFATIYEPDVYPQMLTAKVVSPPVISPAATQVKKPFKFRQKTPPLLIQTPIDLTNAVEVKDDEETPTF